MQLELMKIAMGNAEYAATFNADTSGETFRLFRRETYTNLVFQYLHFSYLVGVSSESALRRALRQELFSHSAGREFWDAVRAVYAEEADSAGSVRFNDIVEEEYRRAVQQS